LPATYNLEPIFTELQERREESDRLREELENVKVSPFYTAACSWLQIRRPGFDSRHYQEKKVVVLERGLLSLVSTTEELLDRKVAAPV
jgi:hypothetical protein